ncbi:hypothetical protein Purlil1_12170 [Purpureocillium lilacinum]|uniref:Uncharacterized protein n=1 Tax=Purpureocillium lilacinum TaxID=33203 RepID=A0ABR0BHP8_PURLI|nr:hypothetical protein Purlil1_12170 [Purpureocillium lilacinum]
MDVSGAALKSVITNHIHQDSPNSWASGIMNPGFRVETLPPFPHTSIHHPEPLQHVPFVVYSREDMEDARRAKRRRIMQERSVNSMTPMKTTTQGSPGRIDFTGTTHGDVENARETNKIPRCSGILTPVHTSVASTSPVYSDTSEARMRVLYHEEGVRPKVRPKTGLPQAWRNRSASVMSLSNLVNNFGAVAGGS